MAPTNPIINLFNTYSIWYNVETITLYNLNGQVYNFDWAIRRPVITDLEDDIGSDTYGQRTKTHFLIAVSQWDRYYEFPQTNARIVDSDNTTWYVSKIENVYFGNILKVYCESRAGLGVTDRQFPAPTPAIGDVPCALMSNSFDNLLFDEVPDPDTIALYGECEITPTQTNTPKESPTPTPSASPSPSPTPTPTAQPLSCLTDNSGMLTPIANGFSFSNLTAGQFDVTANCDNLCLTYSATTNNPSYNKKITINGILYNANGTYNFMLNSGQTINGSGPNPGCGIVRLTGTLTIGNPVCPTPTPT